MKIIAEQGNEQDANFMKETAQSASGFSAMSLRSVYADYLVRQNEGVIADGMVVLSDAAQNASPWYLRYTAMNNLETLKDGLAERAESETDQDWLPSMVGRIDQIMTEIKANETNPTLKSYWK